MTRTIRARVGALMRNLWAKATLPPPPAPLTYRSMPGGPPWTNEGWTNEDYEAAKIEREEGWSSAETERRPPPSDLPQWR